MSSDLDRQIEKLKRCEALTEEEVKRLCVLASEMLVDESNVQHVDTPVTLCGDIQGQFYDLLGSVQTRWRVPEDRLFVHG